MDLKYTNISTIFLNHGDPLSESAYDILLNALKNPDSQVDVVIHYLQDLEQCISLLDGQQNLINIILNMSWLDRGLDLAIAYRAFILTMVSAHTNLLKPCLRSLIRKFIPEEKLSQNTEDLQLSQTQQSGHVHALLRSLSHLVPMTSIILPSILEDHFPYLTKPSFFLKYYSQNVLTVSDYLPTLRLQLLELITKNLLKLDVRLPRTAINSVLDSDKGEDNIDNDEDALFMMEDLKSECKVAVKSDPDLKPDLDLKSDLHKSDSNNVLELKSDVKKKVDVEKLAEKLSTCLPLATTLDSGMELMFKFIRETCYPNGNLNWPVTKKLYRELLSVFDKFIFPTHESVHVQYLMFYICSFKEELADGFVDYLWKKVTNPSSQAIYRQAAAYYIGSFLARASYNPIRTCRDTMALMGHWVHSYLDQTTDQHPHADLAHHGPFYVVCQSLFYLFCFHHNEIMQLRHGPKWADSLNFQRIVTSKLNPLRVCVPIVAKTFASVTRMHQLAFCDTIIERNNRYHLPVALSSFALERSIQVQLEAYFPFDPYLLPRSCQTFASLYRQFSGSLPDEEEQEEEEDDDFLPEEDDQDLGLGIGAHIAMSLEKSPMMDFMQYSVSPGFKHT